MKTSLQKYMLVAALLAASNIAWAGGPYLIAGIGMSSPASSVKNDFDAALVAAGAKGVTSTLSNGTSLAGGVGYSFGDSFAVEGAYFNSGTLTHSATGTNFNGSISTDIKLTTMQLAVLSNFPINKNVSLFGKLGYSWETTDATIRVSTVNTSISDKKNSVGYGAGVIYKLSDQFSVRAGWDAYASDLSGFSFGAQIGF
jgi:opacity protein-like surface antigen